MNYESDLKIYYSRVNRLSRNNIRARAFTELREISRLGRDRKAINPNADLLVPMKLLADFTIKSSGIDTPQNLPATVLVSEIYDGKSKITLAGLLRAMVALKAMYPEVFAFFIEFARLMSIQTEDRMFKYPPAVVHLYRAHQYFASVWEHIEEKYGFTPEKFVTALCQLMVENGYEDLIDNVAFFHPIPNEDIRIIQEVASAGARRQVSQASTDYPPDVTREDTGTVSSTQTTECADDEGSD